MKRLFTTFLTLLGFVSVFIITNAQAQHSFELSPNSLKLKQTTIPFVASRQYIPMGSHRNSTLAMESLSNFNSAAIDANGLVAGNFTAFGLPDTSMQAKGMPSDGTYIGNQLMEYFTSTLNTIYLDSIQVGLVANAVPVKITSFAYGDTVNQNQFPVPYVQIPPLASAQLLKSALKIDDTIRFYTIKYNHKLLKNSKSVDPQSFFVSVSTLASTATANPFFVNPPTSSNRIKVLSDFFPETPRAADPTTDKMYQSRTRLDGQWVSYGAVAGLPDTLMDGTVQGLYPNLIMWAFVSDGVSGVNDTKLNGNALAQNYPNPFNPSTVIKYSLEKESKVSIKLYNALGMEVAMILDANQGVGENQVTFNGDNLPSGTYFYTMKAGTFSQTKRMVLAK